MERITALKVTGNHRLLLEFSDGLAGELEFFEPLRGPMLVPLREPSYFAQVRLDDWGAPVWPNGVDFSPEVLHERLREPAAAVVGS